MLEIGPGMGAMTENLLPYLSQMDVIELDRDLVVYLKKRFPADKLTIHQGMHYLRFRTIAHPVKTNGVSSAICPTTSPRLCCFI